MMVTCCGELFLESSRLVERTGLNPTCNAGPVYKLILGLSVEVTWRAQWLPVFLKYPVLFSQHGSETACWLLLLPLPPTSNLQLLSLLLLPHPSLQSTGPSYRSIHVGLQYTKTELTFPLPLQSKEVRYRRISLISSLVFMCLFVCMV